MPATTRTGDEMGGRAKQVVGSPGRVRLVLTGMILCLVSLAAISSQDGRSSQAKGLGQSTWTRVSAIGGFAVEILAFGSADGQVSLAGTYHGGLYRTADGGATWTVALEHAVGALAAEEPDRTIVYAGTWGEGVFASSDGGATWTASSTGLVAEDVYALAIDLDNSNVMFAGTNLGVFKSADRGSSWQAASTGLTGRNVYALAAAGSVWIAGSDVGAFRSIDAGATWAPASSGLTGTEIYALTVGPDGAVWAGTDCGVSRSGDGGLTWVDAGFGLPRVAVHAVVVKPASPSEGYAATALGVYATVPGGGFWSPFNEGLSGWALQVSALVLDATGVSPILYAGTGAGIWQREAGVPTTWQLNLPIMMRRFREEPPPTPTATSTLLPAQTPTLTPTPTQTETKPPTPTPTPLFCDDFEDPASGWMVDDNATRRFAYVEGEYQILVKPESRYVRISHGSGFKYTDCGVEVDGRLATDTYGAYGLLFGITSDWDSYVFQVVSRGKYALWRLEGGSWHTLVGWTSSTHINEGQGSNHLRVVRRGSAIGLYVNGHHLTTVSDSCFLGPLRVGLIATAYTNPDVDVRFDDFCVYPVEDGDPTPTHTVTSVQTPAHTPTATQSQTGTLVPSATPTRTRTKTSTPTRTRTPTRTATRTPTRTRTPSHTVAPSATATTVPGGPIYSDDFGNPDSGWPRWETAQVLANYVDDEYRLMIKVAGVIAQSPSFYCVDCAIETDLRNATGSPGYYGVVHGNADYSRYYALFINDSGYYWLAKYSSGWHSLTDWTESPFIFPGTATNHLRLEHQGTQIKAYINRNHVHTVTDSELTGSLRVGVIVSTSSPNCDVRFDNYEVYALGGGGADTDSADPAQTMDTFLEGKRASACGD